VLAIGSFDSGRAFLEQSLAADEHQHEQEGGSVIPEKVDGARRDPGSGTSFSTGIHWHPLAAAYDATVENWASTIGWCLSAGLVVYSDMAGLRNGPIATYGTNTTETTLAKAGVESGGFKLRCT
jgi:hypothetical protein